MCGHLSCAPYGGPNLARNPGRCPDWESNQRPFGLQAGAQSTEPHQPGLCFSYSYNPYYVLLYTEMPHSLLSLLHALTYNSVK